MYSLKGMNHIILTQISVVILKVTQHISEKWWQIWTTTDLWKMVTDSVKRFNLIHTISWIFVHFCFKFNLVMIWVYFLDLLERVNNPDILCITVVGWGGVGGKSASASRVKSGQWLGDNRLSLAIHSSQCHPLLWLTHTPVFSPTRRPPLAPPSVTPVCSARWPSYSLTRRLSRLDPQIAKSVILLSSGHCYGAMSSEAGGESSHHIASRTISTSLFLRYPL